MADVTVLVEADHRHRKMLPGETLVDGSGSPVGGGGTPSATVASATSFGVTPAAGAASEYSRGDHNHGTPAAPTLAGLGAGDSATKNVGTIAGTVAAGDDARLSNARPASDVSTWAKAGTKPSYTYSEVGADPAGAAAAITLAGLGGVPTSRHIDTTAPVTGGGDLTADRTIAVSDFTPSGTGHARGTVPDPGAAAGTTKFLREDATWAVPAGGSGLTHPQVLARVSLRM